MVKRRWPRKTARQRIYWEYAKLITEAATGSRTSSSFVRGRYVRLMVGVIHPSTILRENKLLMTSGKFCAYCESTDGLEWEHIVPRSRGGPDTIDNMVWACRECNARKGARDPGEWYTDDGRKNEIPRLVLGKFLKIAFEAHEAAGTLDWLGPDPRYGVALRDVGAVFRKPNEPTLATEQRLRETAQGELFPNMPPTDE